MTIAEIRAASIAGVVIFGGITVAVTWAVLWLVARYLRTMPPAALDDILKTPAGTELMGMLAAVVAIPLLVGYGLRWLVVRLFRRSGRG